MARRRRERGRPPGAGWHKTPSVSYGGKQYFWYRRVALPGGGSVGERKVWNRVARKWVFQRDAVASRNPRHRRRGKNPLIRGDELTPAQRAQVLNAFIYRWTTGNWQREKVYWNITKPRIPLISDEQWLREHAFHFTKSGRLHEGRRFAEPHYMAKNPRWRKRRPVKRNTQQWRVSGVRTGYGVDDSGGSVNYRGTTVVRWNNDEIVLNTGGWKSAATKTRMQQASHQFGLGYEVQQKAREWFVHYQGRTIPFVGSTLRLAR